VKSDKQITVLDVLDRVTTYVDPVYLVGDVNICIDRPANPSTRQFMELLTAHGSSLPCDDTDA